jgi:uncharacterized lipoprotein YajG
MSPLMTNLKLAIYTGMLAACMSISGTLIYLNKINSLDQNVLIDTTVNN